MRVVAEREVQRDEEEVRLRRVARAVRLRDTAEVHAQVCAEKRAERYAEICTEICAEIYAEMR